MSRAACSAMVASLACSEPTCLCASPLRLRMKTSHSGVFGVAMTYSLELFRSLRGLPVPALLGIGRSRLAHPRALLVRLASRRYAVAVARAVAGEHLFELGPIDLAVAPMAVGILRHAGIGNRQPQELRLRHGGVDEFLAQFVVGEALDLPFGGGVAVLADLVGRAEHHQNRPPPAVQRILRHRPLLLRAARQRQHDLVALPMMKKFLPAI